MPTHKTGYGHNPHKKDCEKNLPGGVRRMKEGRRFRKHMRKVRRRLVA